MMISPWVIWNGSNLKLDRGVELVKGSLHSPCDEILKRITFADLKKINDR